MATISSLVVSISANTRKLKSGLSKASASVSAFAAKSAKRVLSLTAAFTAVGAAASLALGGGLLAILSKNTAAIDKMAKAASKLGVGVEALQKLNFIAERTGVSVETMGTSIQRMIRRVSEAAKGTGEAVAALEELNLNATDLARLSPDKQFEAISAAMKDVATQGDRVRLAMKLFDTEGVSLVNSMAADIKALGAEFDGLGITITKRQAAMASSFEDSKTTLKTLLSGFGRVFSAEVAPALEKVVKRIISMIKEMGGLRVVAIKFAKATISGIIGAVKGFSALINKARGFGVELIDLQAKWLAFKSVVTLDNIFDSGGVNKQFDDLFQDRLDLQLKLQGGDKIGEKLTKELEAVLASVGKETVKANSHVELYKRNQDELAKQAQKTAEAVQDLGVASKKTASINKGVNISDQFLQFIDQAKRGINSGSSFTEGNFTALNNLIAASKNNAALPETTQAMQQMVDSLRNVQASTQASADAVKQQTEENKKTVGELTINMITDAGVIAGKIFGEPEFLERLKTFVGNQTNDTTRAVIN